MGCKRFFSYRAPFDEPMGRNFAKIKFNEITSKWNEMVHRKAQLRPTVKIKVKKAYFRHNFVIKY